MMVSETEPPQKDWQLVVPTWLWLRCARIWATTAQTGPRLCVLEGEVIVYMCERNSRKSKCVFVFICGLVH